MDKNTRTPLQTLGLAILMFGGIAFGTWLFACLMCIGTARCEVVSIKEVPAITQKAKEPQYKYVYNWYKMDFVYVYAGEKEVDQVVVPEYFIVEWMDVKTKEIITRTTTKDVYIGEIQYLHK